MSFVYTTGIPAGTDIPAQSAPLFAANFSYINVMANRDHFMTLNSANSNDGTHRQVTLTNQSSGPGFVGGNAALYSGKVSGGNSYPIWQNSDGSTFMFSVDPSLHTNGYTGLPGGGSQGIILQWGFVNVTLSGGQASDTVTFSTSNIAFPNNCWNVVTGIYYIGSTAPSSSSGTTLYIKSDSISKTEFDWTMVSGSSVKTQGFYWLAIGN